VLRALSGVPIRETEAITLTGRGTRTRRIIVGPCFRITLREDRVREIELQGVRPRARRKRRRRRRRH
jgi:hypothetical protein